MVAWHRSRRADILLRLLGLALCAIAYLAFARLVALHIAPGTRSPAIAYALALVGFLSGSMGNALTFLGHHLFDEVEVSARWRTRRPDLHADGQGQAPSIHRQRHPAPRTDEARLACGPIVIPPTLGGGAAFYAHG